jgi:hypothetical protein
MMVFSWGCGIEQEEVVWRHGRKMFFTCCYHGKLETREDEFTNRQTICCAVSRRGTRIQDHLQAIVHLVGVSLVL